MFVLIYDSPYVMLTLGTDNAPQQSKTCLRPREDNVIPHQEYRGCDPFH